MSKKLYEETNLQNIANAIRQKNGTQNTYTAAQMANAVRAITTQPNLETLSVDQNGRYLPGAGKDGFSEVTVNVSSGGGSGAVVQPLSATQNGTYNPPSGVDGFAPVTVNVSGGGDDVPIVIKSLLEESYIAFSQQRRDDLDNYVLGIDSERFDNDVIRNDALSILASKNHYLSDIVSLLDSPFALEYYSYTGSDRYAPVMTSDLLSKLNAVLLGNISGEGDLNDSIREYKRILLFGSYNSSFDVSQYDVGIIYPAITLETPYLTGTKDRNPSYKAVVVFTSNNHVTVKSSISGENIQDRRARIYGIP